ncbi:aminotransferase class I/II-fold pyridoxal phosphate-dependent enzyme [Phototrophicus methaneseepsis]|uniref:Aminotransferase class I/II-fold pyridoxal phosphate-dependent enzyme n=1 Tax=Phototrophicus methaneseepsis TaxID=2710758 RepID=A0A7S8E5B4_9CHLR|nr:aminotransferase class I/II-fold pyridoxal phosphate-dependent enzyme [Phototrophicus methaneseepsis]QPC80569.1 aminotransferase class I/II-fold pyridoxal phosphate-dependent enzyme [Phototrophicus methaneseepsis]
MPTYAQRVVPFGTTIFSEINELAQKHNALNLSQGKPDFDGPQVMLDAAIESIRTGQANQYPPGYGIPEMRQAVADHAQHFYNLPITPQDVLISSGAAEGVYAAIMGVVNPGDEVILIEPYFDVYLPIVEWAGAVPVFVPMRPPEWRFDPEELRAAFSEKTRAIIINTPHNPTGRVYDKEELAVIADLCKEFDAIVISDEVYEHLTYEEAKHTPISTLPGMFERTLTVSSAAKTFSVTGWKVGWIMGAPELLTGAWRIRQNVTFAVNHPGQVGVACALQLGADYYDAYHAMYASKRQILIDGLEAAGLKVSSPEGAFYIMADFSDIFDGDDVDFTKYLISEVGVACIPPSAFFSPEHKHLAKDHVRFTYCKVDDVLLAGAEKLAKLRAK